MSAETSQKGSGGHFRSKTLITSQTTCFLFCKWFPLAHDCHAKELLMFHALLDMAWEELSVEKTLLNYYPLANVKGFCVSPAVMQVGQQELMITYIR